jgi:hypothetical protein
MGAPTDGEEERPMLQLGPIEPISRHAFEALLHGEDEAAFDPQLAALLEWIETGEPFRVSLLPDQDPHVVAQAIVRAAQRHGRHVATIAGDGFVAVCKLDASPPPERREAHGTPAG